MSEQQPLLPTSNNYSISQTWREPREKIAQFLESALLHKIIISLIVIDATCVLADLSYSFLSEDCAPPGPDSPEWLETLSQISLVITTIFLIEIPLSLWAFGFRYLNPLGSAPHAALHAFDAVIILTTFVLEVVLRGRERELAALLVVLRLWRLVKLVGGVAVGAGELEEETARSLLETQTELERVKEELNEARVENAFLKQKIAQRGELEA